jgi:hypothetical protein
LFFGYVCNFNCDILMLAAAFTGMPWSISSRLRVLQNPPLHSCKYSQHCRDEQSVKSRKQ